MASWRCFTELWQVVQRLCQFDESQKSFWLPRWGMMWSTTLARVFYPRSAQRRQKGSRFR